MNVQCEIRCVKKESTGEVYLNSKDLQAFITDAARECTSEEGKEALVNLNIGLMNMNIIS